MKLIVIKDNLKEAVGVANQMKVTDQNLPVLKNFLLSTEKNKIIFRSTNLEIGAEFFISGKVVEEGSVTIPTSVFNTIIGSLQSDRLNIDKKGLQTIIKTDNYEAVIQGLSPDDFPIIPEIVSENQYLELKGSVLKEAFQQTIIASQFSDLRPELYNLLFDFSIDQIKFAATDSFRLAEKTINSSLFSSNFEDSFKILIPLPTIQQLIPLLKDDVVKITKDEHQVVFVSNNWKIVSRLFLGNFPNYESIVPQNFQSDILVGKGEFQEALKLSSVFGGQLQEVTLRFGGGSKILEIFSENQTIGQNVYRLSAKINSPHLNEAVFNSKYLFDAIKPLGGDSIFLGFNEGNRPIIIKSPKDDSYFYILMPVLKG